MSERRISIIIVPPGGARTIQLSVSVFRIKLIVAVAGLTLVAMLGTTAFGLSLWDSASRGRALEIENDSLRAAISRMSDLDRRLADLERKGGQIRDLLVVNQDGDSARSPGDQAPGQLPEGELHGENGVGYAEVNAR